jgi:hypothetical protein
MAYSVIQQVYSASLFGPGGVAYAWILVAKPKGEQRCCKPKGEQHLGFRREAVLSCWYGRSRYPVRFYAL